MEYGRRYAREGELFADDWTFYLMGFGVAILGGIMGALLNWIAILFGIVALFAMKFWKDGSKKTKYLVTILGATWLAAGLASTFFTAADPLSSTDKQSSTSLTMRTTAIPKRIYEVISNTSFVEEASMPTSVVNSIIAQSVGTSSASSTSSSGSATLSY